MLDIMLDREGDIKLSAVGDVFITSSIRQAVRIHLQWFWQEWRLGTEYGFRWFEDVLVKNPNLERIKALVRAEILKVEGVTDAHVSEAVFDKKKRTLLLKYTVCTGEAVFREEVLMNV